MKKTIAICSSLIALFVSSAWITDDPFSALLKKLEEFTQKYPTEHVHLHLDKPYYAIGDDIWFKAYVTDSKTQGPTSLSNVLYVELIDEMDSLKKQLIVPMKNGISWGDFKLTDTLTEGNYRIRAYTQWMRNAGSDFFFDKTIKIGNSWANKVFVKAEYLFNQEGSNEKVNGTIRFADKVEKPYENIEVNYMAELDAKVIAKGRTTTNSKGEINISLINSQPNSYKSGKIIATLTLPDKQKITKTIPIKTTSASVDVQFFPESGSLVQNLPNKVAFKAINADGKGEDIKGIIIDNEGTEITNFETTYLGMGSFSLHPMAGKTYQAKVNGKLFNLPKTESSGYILSVNNNDTNKVAVKVLLSDDLIGKGELQLLVQQNGKVSFSVKIPTAKNFALASLPKSEFPSGISTLTLFNAEAMPVAERLIFVNNSFDKIKIDITNLEEKHEKKGLMNLDLIGLNESTPVQGSFSVSVTNTSAIEPDVENEANIFTSLLLKSELKGYIEKPNAYFVANDVTTRANLDYLLLTQGWRKIDWKAINSSQFPVPNYQPETGLKISGMVTTYLKKPIPNTKVSLFSSSSSAGILAIDTLTDANGRFSFDKLAFTDSTKFVINAVNQKGKKDVELKLDSLPGQIVTSNKNTGDIEVNVNDQLKNYLATSNAYFDEQTKQGALKRSIKLKEVEIIGKKKEERTASSLVSDRMADVVLKAKDLESVTLLSTIITRKANIPLNPTTFRSISMSTITILLDGIYFSGKIDDINPLDVESIQVLKSPNNTAIYGVKGMNGVLVVATKTGGSVSTPVPGVITSIPKGYAIVRQFYSPRYDTNPDPKPDLRTTIYWNPSIVSDKEGKFKLDYFNADGTGLYRVVIEGIDLMGNIARKTFNYQVN